MKSPWFWLFVVINAGCLAWITHNNQILWIPAIVLLLLGGAQAILISMESS